MLTRCDPSSRRFARIAQWGRTRSCRSAGTAAPNPADRFLAATAQVMDLTLVTSDDLLLGLGTIRTMKN
jgi:PIN domain nuclease of toxin-antitoxin system